MGHRLLGPVLPYLLHLRPTEWPIMAGHTALGFLLAEGLSGAIAGERLGQGVFGILLWVVFLNGGTLAINSAFDRDEGDIGYLKQPPPVPPNLLAFSLALLLAGQALAFLLPVEFVWAYAACFLLSLLYSVPPFRLKAVAGADWVINMWGFGALTPYAGWAASGIPLTLPGLIVLLAFCPLFAALYPLTQLYQVEEDQRRGDRTLVIRFGMRLSLDLAIATCLLAFGLFAWAAWLDGWGGGPHDLLRWAGLGIAITAWLTVLLPWRARHREWSSARHQRGMYQALAAWAVTDIVVLLGFATGSRM
jgi:lycopene elongase/hydratase (dihydrobisanhydrobacterioruberin-forming)